MVMVCIMMISNKFNIKVIGEMICFMVKGFLFKKTIGSIKEILYKVLNKAKVLWSI